jgi:hypothetical protein
MSAAVAGCLPPGLGGSQFVTNISTGTAFLASETSRGRTAARGASAYAARSAASLPCKFCLARRVRSVSS